MAKWVERATPNAAPAPGPVLTVSPISYAISSMFKLYKVFVERKHQLEIMAFRIKQIYGIYRI